MATILRSRVSCSRSFISLIRRAASTKSDSTEVVKKPPVNEEVITHTGQQFAMNDYRRIRFETGVKLVNPNFAIDLIKEDPIVVCNQRVVHSHSGGPLGHPKVYINLDPPGVHSCGYSGRKFILEKYFDEAKMGEFITYEQYLDQIKQAEEDDDE